MSDVSRGPGWWVAADGRWYPPDQHPDPAHREHWAADDPGQEAEPEPGPAPTAPDPLPAPSPEHAVSSTAAGPPGEAGGRRGRMPLVVAAVVALVVLIGGVVVVTTRDDGSPTAAPDAGSGETVVLEPLGSPGRDPFASGMSVREVTEFPTEVKAVLGTPTPPAGADDGDVTPRLTRVGTEPGLYGGSGTGASCDVEQLTAFLDEHAPQAEAFAGALGLSGADAIDGYLSGLTPVALTADTLVTNHGFVDGRATPFPAVLQAGTAVLVDDTGIPRVRCACGNPLAPAADDLRITSTSGTAWNGFEPSLVTVVQPGAATGTLVVVDVTTGQNREHPVGAGDTSDPTSVAAGLAVGTFRDGYGAEDGSTIRVSPEGMEGTWTEVHHTDLILYGVGSGDDGFLAVGSELGATSSTVLRGSPDGRTWSQVGVIPGADIRDVAFIGGRWIAVGWADLATGQATTFESDDGATWTELGTITRPDEFGGATGFDQVVTDGEVLVASLRGNAGARSNPHTLYRSTDGRTWSPTTAPIADTPYLAGYGDGHWLANGTDVLASTDGSSWTAISPTGQYEATTGPVRDRAAWYIGGFTPLEPTWDVVATLARSDDGTTWVDVTPASFGAGSPTDFAVAG